MPPVDSTPLEDLFELVSLVYDSDNEGKGPQTHVIIRYKPGVDVQPPEWWLREHAPPTMGSAVIASARAMGNAPPSSGRGGNRTDDAAGLAQTSGDTSFAGRELLQDLWLEESGHGRRTAHLWPRFAHIKLVRVDPSAQSAFFRREQAAPADGSPAPEVQEEELRKTTVNLSQDVLVELHRLQGRAVPGVKGEAALVDRTLAWKDVEETTRFGNQFHIGRRDQQRFRQGSSEFFSDVSFDTYRSTVSDTTGLLVRELGPKITPSYGIVAGDVLLEINNRKVESKAQATNQVRKDYDRGVRTFSTRWLSNGQVVERVYQAPDR